MSVAVFQSERIGDSIMALPAVEGYLSAKKGERVILVTDNVTGSLYEASGAYDRVVSFPYRRATLPTYFSIAKELRRERVSSILILPGGFFAAFIAWLSGAKERVGLTTDMRGLFITHPVQHVADTRHQMEHYLDLIRPLGIKVYDAVPCLSLPPAPLTLPPAIENAKKVIALAPFTKDEVRKMYPLAKWREVIEGLSKAGYALLLLGSKDERERYASFLDDVRDNKNVCDRVGVFSLYETASALARVDGAITNDSGLMHIAYAVGTKTLALFGSTFKEKTGPIGAHTRIIDVEGVCPPCNGKRACDNPRCMDAIPTKRVLREAMTFF